jgi:L-lactate dehydrogenase complex protein LldG
VTSGPIDGSRSEVLARIRMALGRPGDIGPDEAGPAQAVLPAEIPRDYRTASAHPPGDPALLDLLTDRLVDYRASVRRCPPDAVGETVAAAFAEHAARTVAAPSGMRVQWLPGGMPTAEPATPESATSEPATSESATPGSAEEGVPRGQAPRVLFDLPRAPLDVATLDAVDGVVTGCAVAIAETGTIVLDGGDVCGRRALTLVPDLHVVVVEAGQVVGGVPEAIGRLDPVQPMTWISGPSATSDIELQRVEGVHGPRTLIVVLVDP